MVSTANAVIIHGKLFVYQRLEAMLVFMGTPEKHFEKGNENEFDVRSSEETKKRQSCNANL